MRTPPMLLGDPTYQPPARPEKIPDIAPAEFYAYAGEREFRGHHLVEIVLYPVQYNARHQGGQRASPPTRSA